MQHDFDICERSSPFSSLFTFISHFALSGKLSENSDQCKKADFSQVLRRSDFCWMGGMPRADKHFCKIAHKVDTLVLGKALYSKVRLECPKFGQWVRLCVMRVSKTNFLYLVQIGHFRHFRPLTANKMRAFKVIKTIQCKTCFGSPGMIWNGF